MAATSMLGPCNRGDGSRGYHNYRLNPGADRPCCTFCGDVPPYTLTTVVPKPARRKVTGQ